MFAEVNDLTTLIIVPEGPALENPAVWKGLAERFQCGFLIEDRYWRIWTGWWNTTPSVHLLRQSDQTYINPVAGVIKSVLVHFDSQPYNAAYVTFSARNLSAATNTRVGTVLIGPEPAHREELVLPDLLVPDVNAAERSLISYRSGKAVGMVAEAVLYAHGRGWPLGDDIVIWRSRGAIGDDADLVGKASLVGLGRYIASGDARAAKHPLTRRILKAKTNQDPLMALILAYVLEWLDEQAPFQWVTRVPPKLGATADMLGWMISNACQDLESAGSNNGSFVARCKPNLMRCVKPFGKQREAGGASARRENVRGAFACTLPLDDAHVVLLDDVYTTGATAAECCRTLLQAGASSVTVVAFGYDQKVVTDIPTQLLCPSCGSPMAYRFQKDGKGGFWGCTAYPNCKGNRKFEMGLRMWNSSNLRDAIDDTPDISL